MFLRNAVADYLGPHDDLKRTCLAQRVLSAMATLYVTGNMQRYADGDGRLFDEVANYLDRPPHQHHLGVGVGLALRNFLQEEAQPGQVPRETMEWTLGALPQGFGFPHEPGFFLAQLAPWGEQPGDGHRNFIKDAGCMAPRIGVALARPQERAACETAANELLELATTWERQPRSSAFAEPWCQLHGILHDTPLGDAALDLPPSITLRLEKHRNRVINLRNALTDPARPRDTRPIFCETEAELIDALLGKGAAAAATARTATTAATSVHAPVEAIITDLDELLGQLNAALGYSAGFAAAVPPRTATGSSELDTAIEIWYSHNADAQSSQWLKYAERDGAHEFADFLRKLHQCKDAYPEWELDATVPAALATFVVNENVVDEILRVVKSRAHDIPIRTMGVFLAVNQTLDTQRAQAGRYDNALSELIAIGKAAFHCAQQERQLHDMYVALCQPGSVASVASVLTDLRNEIDTEVAAGVRAPHAAVDPDDVLRRLKGLHHREFAHHPGPLLAFLLLDWPPFHETLKRLDPGAHAELQQKLRAVPQPGISLQLHRQWVHSVLSQRNEHAALNELFGSEQGRKVSGN
ncbi:hypothetical protein CEY04_17610 [Achromobacter sp. HZ28]|nr:hypothetical protein CEY04_17610 [Achromobacter sp. HZ28]OWT76069.1 hypothetical protein CEY05_13060 [Achromobacter sp. HZ34]